MQAVLVFIVTIGWSVYLGMWLLSRREQRSMNSIATFHKHLAILGRTGPASVTPGLLGSAPLRSLAERTATTAPPRMSITDARNRRRQVLTCLVAAASVTAALAFIGGRALVVLHLLVDLLLAGYLVALVRAQQATVEPRSTVVYLPTRLAPGLGGEPAYLRRSAN